MNDGILDRLRQEDPADVEALRAQGAPPDVLAAIVSTAREPEDSRPPGWQAVRPARTRRLARILVPAGSAATACLIAVLVLVDGGTRTADTAAAAALRDAAAIARSRPAPALPGDGRYLYVRVENVPSLAFPGEPPFRRGIDSEQDFSFLALVPNVQELWLNADGGRQRIVNGEARFPSDRDRNAWIAAGRPSLPGGDVSVDDLGRVGRLDLPTDPDALYERLESAAAERGPGREAYMFTLVGDALREWSASPAQRAALFEVAARIPGVEALGERTDPAGRKGLAFAMRDEHDPYRVTLIVDPQTSQLLHKGSVTLPGNPIPAGTVVESSTYATPEVVERIGDRRPAGE